MAYRVTYVVDLFSTGSERKLSRDVLDAMLELLFKIDIMYLRRHPNTPWLYHSGVKYQEEPIGQEEWQDIPTTLRLGMADCEDLAAWRAAEMVVRQNINAKPVFIEQRRKDGGYLYHIVVLKPDRTIEDPSRVLGMK